MTNQAMAAIAASILIASPTFAKEKLGDLNCQAGQIAKYDGTSWVCSSEANTNYILVDAEGRTIGYPVNFTATGATTLLDSSDGLIEVSWSADGFQTTIGPSLLYYDAQDCQGNSFLQANWPEQILISPAESEIDGQVYIRDSEQGVQNGVDIYSAWQYGYGCLDLSTTSNNAATLTLREVPLAPDQCMTPNYGLDDAAPMGRALKIAAFSEHKDLANTGQGTLQALFLITETSDAEPYNRQTQVEVYTADGTAPGCDIRGTGRQFLVGDDILMDCDTDTVSTQIVDYSVDAEPKCIEAYVTPIPGVTVFPYEFPLVLYPAKATDAWLPAYTPPLKIEKAQND